jgi:outer membrane protein insertion porin family
MRWLLVLSLVSFVPVTAQKPKPPARSAPAAAVQQADAPWPIASIELEGPRIYSREQILAVAGIRPGMPMTAKTLEEAQQRLLASGAFASVAYEYRPSPEGKGYQVTLEIAEVEQIYPLRFEDLALEETEARQWLARQDPLFGEQVSGSEEYLKRLAAQVERYLESKGTPEKVRGQVIADAPEKLVVLVRPDRPYPKVAEIHFANTKIYPPEILVRRFFNVAVGSNYTERRFRELLQSNIAPMYEERGRLGVKFTKIETAPAEDVKGLVVTVEVDEGPVYELASVKVTGEGVPEEELLDAGRFKLEEDFSLEQVERSLERIRDVMRRNGYLKAQTRTERSLDEQARAVHLTVDVDKGPIYQMGRLKIEGLDILGEAAVKKSWTLKTGDPFRADYPEFFIEEIKRRNMFDDLTDIKHVVELNDDRQTADVTLIFK